MILPATVIFDLSHWAFDGLPAPVRWPAGRNRLLLWLVALTTMTGCSNPGTPNSAADTGQDANMSANGTIVSEEVKAIAGQRKDSDWFEDITDASGLRFTYRNGVEGGHFTILESIGGKPELHLTATLSTELKPR